jgi:GR25 family glycosyltransferase involved in LPS biosynthesis
MQYVMISLGRLPFLFFHAGYARLAVVLQSIFAFLDRKPQRRRALVFFKNVVRLRAMIWEGEQDYPVYVINLDRDEKRMISFKKRANEMSLQYVRCRGIDLLETEFDFGVFKNLLGEKFYGNDLFPRGSFASFLSHREVWLRFLESENPIAVICEDDALPIGRFPKYSKDFFIPKDADVVFVNNRMGEGFLSSEYFNASCDSKLKYYDVFVALMNICREKIIMSGPGLDGYILTKQGAKKLVALYEEIKYTMNNDWFVVFNSLSADQRDQFRKTEGTGRLDKVTLPDGPRLKSYVMIPSLIELGNFETSIKMLDPSMMATRDDLLRSLPACGILHMINFVQGMCFSCSSGFFSII